MTFSFTFILMRQILQYILFTIHLFVFILMRQVLQYIFFTIHLFVFVTSIRSARPQKIQMYWSKIHLDQFQVSFDPLNFTPSIFGCFCSAPDILNYTKSPKEDWFSLAFSVLYVLDWWGLIVPIKFPPPQIWLFNKGFLFNRCKTNCVSGPFSLCSL